MKIAKHFALGIMAVCLGAMPLHAQWNQNSSVGPFTYTDPANWVGGVVSNVFSIPPLSGLTLQFTGDYVLTNGVMINFPGSSNVTFQSDSATPRTLRLSLGNFVRTNNNGGTITIGTNSNPLVVDLNGATRTIGGGAALSTSSALITTLNIGAQIIDSSGFTNGVIFGGGNTYAFLLNNSSTFLGPVTFQSLRGGGFTSIKPIGGGASALGAPLDASNATITIADGGSFGQMKYLGTGDTSDRPFVWNITDYHTNSSWSGVYGFGNSGSGLLKLSGQWLFPTNKSASSELVISAVTAPIEFAGYINGSGNANGTFTYPLFYGNSDTNRITLSGPTNTFKDFYVSNVTLAFNTVAPAGSPSSLGAGTNNIFLDGGSAGYVGWVGGSAQGSSLQYYGTNATFTRNVQLNGGANSFYWALDNAGTNTSLTWSNNIVWNVPTNPITGFEPRYLFINPNINSTNIVMSLIPDAYINVNGTPIGVVVAAANPVGAVVNNGGVVQLLNPSNSFAGGIQPAYSRTIQAATLADIGTVSSIGTGLNPYYIGTPLTLMSGINLGSTDSQRGGTFSYIGTNPATSNQKISIFGSSGVLCSGTIRNDSPNNSSLHLTDTGTWNLYSVMPKCLMTLGGSAQAVNTLDNVLPDVNGVGNSGSLLVNGSSWRLTAAETYTATTGVANATLILDGSIATGAGVSVGSGGLLTGTGIVNEAVSVVPGGSIGAGDGGIGTLTISGTLTNAGTLTMKISKQAGTNDQIVVTGSSLTYGGGLTVTNLGGTLALNDTFTLFVSGSYSGFITSSNLPPLASGLAWDVSGLTNNGSIKVVVGPVSTPPVITGVSLVPGDLVLKGTNGSVNGTFYVVTTTNLLTPMANWTYLFTNQFDGSGNFNVTNPYNPQWPASFFRIKL